MEKVSIVLMGIAIFLYPTWIILSGIFDENSKRRDLFIGTLGMLAIGSFVLSVILGLLAW